MNQYDMNNISFQIHDQLLELYKKFNYFIKEELPEDWKGIVCENGFKLLGQATLLGDFINKSKAINVIVDAVKSGRIKNFNDLGELIKGKNICNIEQLSCGCNGDFKNVTDYLKNLEIEEANSCLIWSSISSALIICTEFLRIYDVWQNLKEAKFVVDDSRKKLDQINAKIDKIKTKLDKLREFIAKALDRTLSQKERESVIYVIKDRTALMKAEVREMRFEICQIKVRTKNEITKIRECHRDQRFRGVLNTGQAIMSGAQFLATVGVAHPGLLLMKGALTIGHVVIAGMNFRNATVSQEILEQLRQVLDEAEMTEHVLDELEKSILRTERVARDCFESNLPADLRIMALDF